jgi:enoyl-CoA hydratase
MINREDKLNALNNSTLNELKEAVQEVYDNKEIKALIITGSGEKAFVAGADIQEISKLNELNGRKFSEHGQEIFDLIENCHKPVIAAINGFALGGGCELALSCHIRIASKNARLGLPEVSLGLLPGYGGTQRLTRLIGKGRALEIIMTAEMITAEDALAIGLINHMVDFPSELIPMAKEIHQKILKNAPLSIGMVIDSVNAATRNDVNGYQIESNYFSSVMKTKDFGEGTRAFLEKRPPRFTGE